MFPYGSCCLTLLAHALSIIKLLSLQEPVLFSVSVGENIAYGLPDENVSKDDIITAAKAANAHEFIISLPQVYFVYILSFNFANLHLC